MEQSRKTDAAKAGRPRFNDLERDARRIIDANATDDAAFAAIGVVLREIVARAKDTDGERWEDSADQQTQSRLAEALLTHHLQRADFLTAVYLYRGRVDADIPFWQHVLEKSPHRTARAESAWTLMRRYTAWSNEIGLPQAKRQELRQQVRHHGEILNEQYADLVSKKVPSVQALLTALDYSAGAKLPEVRAATLSRRTDTLAAYQGKVVLLDFWATWCGACVADHRKLIALKQDLKDRRFEIISVSADEKPEQVTQYMAKEGKLPWPQWHVGKEGALLKQWGIEAYPTYLLIDREGSIEARGSTRALIDIMSRARQLVASD